MVEDQGWASNLATPHGRGLCLQSAAWDLRQPNLRYPRASRMSRAFRDPQQQSQVSWAPQAERKGAEAPWPCLPPFSSHLSTALQKTCSSAGIHFQARQSNAILK